MAKTTDSAGDSLTTSIGGGETADFATVTAFLCSQAARPALRAVLPVDVGYR
ncbi:MAG TPA: hypothetical protein VLL08_09070 [Kineosporiaceae bacterium]|nr:hypothetical protein [Kineosporiaceae bacterium]